MIDYTKPVMVYRNLKHRRKAPPLYSVMQNGRVVSRVRAIMLKDVTFVVREAGRQRVLATGHKNVHAFVRGKIVYSGMGTDKYGKLAKIVYNPRLGPDFMWEDHIAPLKAARCVILNDHGMSGAYFEVKR